MNSNSDSLHSFEEWTVELRQCGWEQVAGFDDSDWLGPDGERLDPSALGALGVRRVEFWTPEDRDGPRLLLVALADRELPSPDRPFARYLDCPRKIRQILDALSSTGFLDFVLLTDQRREYWYDSVNDACLGGESRGAGLEQGASRMRERIWPRLPVDQVRAGALETAQRRPVQTLGDEFSTWLTLWINEIGSAAESRIPDYEPDPDGLHGLFLTLCLWLKGNGHPRIRPALTDDFRALILADEDDLPQVFANALETAFASLAHFFPGRLTRAGMRGAKMVTQLSRSHPTLIQRLAWEWPALSVRKVSTATLVEALGDPQIEMGAWRQSLMAEGRELAHTLTVEGRHVLNPLVVDLDQDGLGWLLHSARWAVHYWKKKIEEEREWRGVAPMRSGGDNRRPQVEAPQRGEIYWQLDLMTPWPVGVSENGHVADTLLYALGNSLRVKTGQPIMRLTGELLLLVMALEETSEEPDDLSTPLDLSGIWEQGDTRLE